MPFTFDCFIFFLLVAIAAAIYKRRARRAAYRKNQAASWVLGASVGLAVVFLVWACLAFVGTKKIAVLTTFGRPSGSLSNGPHLKGPWQKTTDLDAAIQTDSYSRYGKNVDGPPLQVRIGNLSTADLDVTVRWRIRQKAADDLFRNYRSFDHIRNSLVTRALLVTVNDVFAHYNPLGSINGKNVTPPPSLDSLSLKVLKRMRARIGSQIEVISVQTPILHFDKDTQKKINEYQAAKADTRIALQRRQTAANEAAANTALSKSVSHDPNVLVSKCLDTLNLMVRAGQNVPPGMSCWPNGGSAIVVPAAR